AGGNVGIGTTTPGTKLSITNAVSTAQATLAYDSTRYTNMLTDASGNFILTPQSGNAYMNDGNFYVCSGGACPSGTPSGTGNVIAETSLMVGTSTSVNETGILLYGPSGFGFLSSPNNIHLASNAYWDGTNWRTITANQASVVDALANGDILFLSTSTAGTPGGIISGLNQLMTIKASGFVGVGTTSPTQMFSVQDRLYVGANGATGMGTATSTFQGDIKITGKLDVGTIDPVYTIDGVKYATYGASTIGIKEEMVAKVPVTAYDAERKLYTHTIFFTTLPIGSDLWLFYNATDFGEEWDNLVVSLTPSFDGRVFYEQNPKNNSLTIFSTMAGNVSLRMIANRYDHRKWPNLRPDQDSDFTHHVLHSK
ncbi:hypothetical protein EBR66_04215, partial [bacterium]|nr:hypothetical protein [bacterium]